MRKTLPLVLFLGLTVLPLDAVCEDRKRQRVPAYSTTITKRVLSLNLTSAKEAATETQREVLDRSGAGPSPQPVRLDHQLEVRGLVDFGLSSLQQLTSLSLEVFRDVNPASGIFYYKPKMYFLNWNPDDEYFLTVDYKPEESGGKNVVIDARLTPGAVMDDVRVLERLLQAHYLNEPAHVRPNPSDIRVYPLPATYEARFNLAGLGVDESDVSVTGVDRDTGQIGLQITTTVATKEILIKKLGDPQGLQGDVFIRPQGVTEEQEPPAPFSVTARLKLADSEAYANARWRREAGDFSAFHNAHAFPLRLKYLTYLIQDGRSLILRGWDLGSPVLLPGGVARIPNAGITTQIDDSRVIRSWYVYALENDTEYRDRVINALTGGVGLLPVKTVNIEVVQSAELFEEFHLYKVAVVVRSAYFDPNGGATEPIEMAYEFSAEDGAREMAPLYVPEEAASPVYEYRIGVVTADGVETVRE